MRSGLIVVAMVGLWGCASQSARPSASAGASRSADPAIPSDLRESVERSETLGHQLYVLDRVAAIGTDVFFANVPEAQRAGIAGYLPLQEGNEETGEPTDSFLVSFFTAENPPRIAYGVRVAPDVKPTFERFEPPHEALPGLVQLIGARQRAIAALPTKDQPINPVVLPSDAPGEALVYLLAGTTTPNVAVFGQHFRVRVPLEGDGVTEVMPLSKTALEIPMRGPNGEPSQGFAVTHLITDFPLETHVLVSLQTKLPVYVRTDRGTWLVDGDRISFRGQGAAR